MNPLSKQKLIKTKQTSTKTPLSSQQLNKGVSFKLDDLAF